MSTPLTNYEMYISHVILLCFYLPNICVYLCTVCILRPVGDVTAIAELELVGGRKIRKAWINRLLHSILYMSVVGN